MNKFQVLISSCCHQKSHFDLADPVCTIVNNAHMAIINSNEIYIDESHLRFFVVVTIASIEGENIVLRPFNHQSAQQSTELNVVAPRPFRIEEEACGDTPQTKAPRLTTVPPLAAAPRRVLTLPTIPVDAKLLNLFKKQIVHKVCYLSRFQGSFWIEEEACSDALGAEPPRLTTVPLPCSAAYSYFADVSRCFKTLQFVQSKIRQSSI